MAAESGTAAQRLDAGAGICPVSPEPGDGVGQRLGGRAGASRPSSARLREASKCIVRRVRRTPVTVALGVRPVTWSAQNSLSEGDGQARRG